MPAPPVLVIGVSRSGTTLLKEMLNAHSELAIPTESYFIPQLWDRHKRRLDIETMLADLGRLARVREWGVTPEDVRERLPDAPSFSDVIQAVYRAYADARGKTRFGDKTPIYMQHLDLLDQVFPEPQYVHIVRDGRNAALSFVSMRRRPRFNWSRPRGLADFACAWRVEVSDARRFGRTTAAGRYLELRYEDLVADPERLLRVVCAFLRLDFEPTMLDYHVRVDQSTLLDHPRLSDRPTGDVRRWREEMRPQDVEVFEAIAGDVLSALGYERAYPAPSGKARARAAVAAAHYRARLRSWRTAVAVARASPAWRLRQIYVRRTG